jgi:hypothetical protein
MTRAPRDEILAARKTSPTIEPEARSPTMTTHDTPYENSLEGARAWFAHNGLTRPREGRLIAGVTAGFARR